MKVKIYQVDAFTTEILHGNPAGVVPFADGLSEEQMQRIARELNNSETAFVFEPDSQDYDVKVRFFTPTNEVPLCGHATVAAHYVRAHEGIVPCGRTYQKTGAGILAVDTKMVGNDYVVTMTQGTPFVGEPFSDVIRDDIKSALGLAEEDMRKDTPVCIASAGHSKIMVGIKSVCKLNSLSPDMSALKEISGKVGCNGYYVFTLDVQPPHTRDFSRELGGFS